MFVRQLSLINIKGYEEANINLSPGINVLVGANNAGKSTIIHSLLRLQPMYVNNMQDDIRKTFKQAVLYWSLSDINKDEQNLLVSRIKGKRSEINDPLEIFYLMQRKPENTVEGDMLILPTKDKIQLLKNKEFDENIRSQKIGEAFIGFSSMEDESNFIYPFLSRRKTTNYNNQSGRQASYSVLSDMQNLPSRIQSLVHPSHPHSQEFAKYCKEILGFGIAKVPTYNNEDKLGLFVKHGEAIFLDSMGDGVAHILGLLVILLTEDRKLFLIEEIENDIHPIALKKLLNLIVKKSKQNQFVVSTHSNIVLKYLAAADHSKVFYIDWQMKKKKKDGRDVSLPSSKIREVENVPSERMEILKQLGYDPIDFDLFSAYLILEESSAERLIRDYLIPEFVPELLYKIKTIAASGADDIEPRFQDFMRLFVFIHTASIYDKKAWVLADGDPAGIKNINGLRSKFTTWPKENFMNFSEKYFESYYPAIFKKRFTALMGNTKLSKQQRKDEKIILTKDLLKWITDNKVEAKKQFANSAKEVIGILQEISKKI